jgi:hypothetical protein
MSPECPPAPINGPNLIRLAQRDTPWTTDRDMASRQLDKAARRRFIPSGLAVFLSLVGASPKTI